MWSFRSQVIPKMAYPAFPRIKTQFPPNLIKSQEPRGSPRLSPSHSFNKFLLLYLLLFQWKILLGKCELCSSSFYVINITLFISVLKRELNGLLCPVHIRSVPCRNSGCQQVIFPLSFLVLLPLAPVTSSQIRTILPSSPAALIFFLLLVHEFVILYNSLWSWKSKGNLKPTRCFYCWKGKKVRIKFNKNLVSRKKNHFDWKSSLNAFICYISVVNLHLLALCRQYHLPIYLE